MDKKIRWICRFADKHNFGLFIFMVVLLFISAVLNTHCSTCSLMHPFDGKAVNWCERELRAGVACEESGGVKGFTYGWANCKSGEKFPID